MKRSITSRLFRAFSIWTKSGQVSTRQPQTLFEACEPRVLMSAVIPGMPPAAATVTVRMQHYGNNNEHGYAEITGSPAADNLVLIAVKGQYGNDTLSVTSGNITFSFEGVLDGIIVNTLGGKNKVVVTSVGFPNDYFVNISGGSKADNLTSNIYGGGRTTIRGEGGPDKIIYNAIGTSQYYNPADLFGGDDGDVFVTDADGPVNVNGEKGNDRSTSYNSLGNSPWNSVYGGDGNDTIVNFSNGSLYGGNGNDTLVGRGNYNTMNGGNGTNILRGMTGNNTFVIDADTGALTKNTIHGSSGSDSVYNYSTVGTIVFYGNGGWDNYGVNEERTVKDILKGTINRFTLTPVPPYDGGGAIG